MIQDDKNKQPTVSALNREKTSLGLGNRQKRKPTQQLMQEMSESMVKQNKVLIREIDSMSKAVDNMSKRSRSDSLMNERIHDRLESLILEQRTTNILLSQMVSMHKVVMGNESQAKINNTSESIRSEAYNRVLNGE